MATSDVVVVTTVVAVAALVVTTRRRRASARQHTWLETAAPYLILAASQIIFVVVDLRREPLGVMVAGNLIVAIGAGMQLLPMHRRRAGTAATALILLGLVLLVFGFVDQTGFR
jgi:hypothetical protein